MTTDFNGRQIIAKGTVVTVRTSNGGCTTARLAANHYPTYDAVLEAIANPTHIMIIPSFRITSVEAV